MALIIGIFLDWNDLDGQCTLTGLEHFFRTGQWDSRPAEESEAPEFFRPTINKIFSWELSRDQASRLNNFLFMSSFAIGFAKLIYVNNL